MRNITPMRFIIFLKGLVLQDKWYGKRRWNDGLRSVWAKKTEEKSEEEEISFLGRCTLFNYASALFLRKNKSASTSLSTSTRSILSERSESKENNEGKG